MGNLIRQTAVLTLVLLGLGFGQISSAGPSTTNYIDLCRKQGLATSAKANQFGVVELPAACPGEWVLKAEAIRTKTDKYIYEGKIWDGTHLVNQYSEEKPVVSGKKTKFWVKYEFVRTPIKSPIGISVVGLPSSCTVTIYIRGTSTTTGEPVERSLRVTGGSRTVYVAEDLPPGNYALSATTCQKTDSLRYVPVHITLPNFYYAGSDLGTTVITVVYDSQVKLTVYVTGLPQGTSFRIPILYGYDGYSYSLPGFPIRRIWVPPHYDTLTVTMPTQTFWVDQYAYPVCRIDDEDRRRQEYYTPGKIEGVLYKMYIRSVSYRVHHDLSLDCYIDFYSTGSIVLDITSPVNAADVWLIGNNYTRPGRYIINYIVPGVFGFGPDTKLYAYDVIVDNVPYTPKFDETSIRVRPRETTLVKVAYERHWNYPR